MDPTIVSPTLPHPPIDQAKSLTAPAPSSDLVTELTALLGAASAAKVARILLALAEGSSLEDACVTADIPYMDFTLLAKSHDIVSRNVDRSRLKYKERLLKGVRGEDKTIDGKTAMWLLERAFPEEFGPNARKPDESVSKRKDVMREAFEFIRNNPKPLVNPNAGKFDAMAPSEESKGPTAEQAAAARASLERVMGNVVPA